MNEQMTARLQTELRLNHLEIARLRKELTQLKKTLKSRNQLLLKLRESECNCSRSQGLCLRCQAANLMYPTQIVGVHSIQVMGGIGRAK